MFEHFFDFLQVSDFRLGRGTLPTKYFTDRNAERKKHKNEGRGKNYWAAPRVGLKKVAQDCDRPTDFFFVKIIIISSSSTRITYQALNNNYAIS
jgi:hypothetical protein